MSTDSSFTKLKGAVRRVAHAHYDTYVIMKPDSRPDGTAIRDHARVRVLYTRHTRTRSAGCDGDGRSCSSSYRRSATNCES